jgi:PLP dependent protein
MNTTVASQLSQVRDALGLACASCQRNRDEVILIAVSKTIPVEKVCCAYQEGQRHFAESRQQEAQTKTSMLPPDAVWHFIGRIQKNKVRKILPSFPFLHSVDSLRLAEYIDFVAHDMRLRPHIFLEVNLGEEASKGGFLPAQLEAEFPRIAGLSDLHIVGLMCIPPYDENPESSRKYFRMLRELRDRLQLLHSVSLPGLSMGMSHDYPVAIAEGATHVRVGTSIFGDRLPVLSV